jgi:hypothetical protein
MSKVRAVEEDSRSATMASAASRAAVGLKAGKALMKKMNAAESRSGTKEVAEGLSAKAGDMSKSAVSMSKYTSGSSGTKEKSAAYMSKYAAGASGSAGKSAVDMNKYGAVAQQKVVEAQAAKQKRIDEIRANQPPDGPRMTRRASKRSLEEATAEKGNATGDAQDGPPRPSMSTGLTKLFATKSIDPGDEEGVLALGTWKSGSGSSSSGALVQPTAGEAEALDEAGPADEDPKKYASRIARARVGNARK